MEIEAGAQKALLALCLMVMTSSLNPATAEILNDWN